MKVFAGKRSAHMLVAPCRDDDDDPSAADEDSVGYERRRCTSG